jgi:hypothetical protein
MCYSPCLMHTTRTAFVQRQLLQCRTCGSQAFHVLDCCRNPDYVRVPTSPLGERLKAWLGGISALVQTQLFRQRACPEPPASPEGLDAWESRPIIIKSAGDARAPRVTGIDKVAEEIEDEMASVPR